VATASPPADAHLETPVLIENATAEVHAARRRHQRELSERSRYRRLVESVDEVIEACELTHLQGVKECPTDLAANADEVLQNAVRLVAGSDDVQALRLIVEQNDRHKRRITEVMDALWIVQEVVFDLMLPWRVELPEDIEVAGVPVPGPWRYHSAA